MATSPITEIIIGQVEELPPAQQQLVLSFVSSLTRPSGRPGQDVLHLVGTIDKHDLETMRQVADEECEQIEPYEG